MRQGQAYLISVWCWLPRSTVRYEREAAPAFQQTFPARHSTRLQRSNSLALDANAAMTETPNSASAASCSSVWQALRIMLQLPDLLGKFLLSLPLSHFRFVSSFAFALASVSVCSQVNLLPFSLQLCVAFGAVDSRWATTSSLPSSTTISGHTGMHWLVASWHWPWPPVGHCVSVASNAIASITSTLCSMDCFAHCWAVASCSAGSWVSQRRGGILAQQCH